MDRKLLATAAATLVALACGETQERVSPAPTAPLAEVTALTSVPPCDFNAMNPLVARYFPAGEAQVVKGLIDEMVAAGAGSVTARSRGFDVMQHIAGKVDSATGGAPQDAAALTNELIKCMATSVAELPEPFPEDFSMEVTTALPGAYAVRSRSGVTGDATAVLSRDEFSGVGPQSGFVWDAVLAGNDAPQRVLLYGHRVPTEGSYDAFEWKAFPRNTTFDPEVIVGLCIDEAVDTTSMIHEEHVGILQFADASFLDPVSCLNANLSMGGLERLLARMASALLLPRPLSAAVFLSPGGVGGLAGGLRSKFNERDVPDVSLEFVVPPSDNVVSGTIFPPVKVRALSQAGEAVAGVQITLRAINNNGQTVQLLGDTIQVTINDATEDTANDGIAVFDDLHLTKTGGYRLVAVGTVVNRPAIVVPPTTSKKFNIRPAK